MELRVNVKVSGVALFKTDVRTPLFDLYLSMIPEGEIRQHFNCNTCRGFFHRYGTLVYVDDTGSTRSIIWNEDLACGVFKDIVRALNEEVESSRMTQVLCSNANTYVTGHEDHIEYGTAETEEWSHFHANISRNVLIPDYGITSEECMHIFSTVRLALNRYINAIDRAIAIASTELLHDKNTLSTLKAVKEVMDDVNNSKGQCRTNKLWKYAFEKYNLLYHLAGSVEGSLMDDIINNIDDDTVIERFNEKVDPMNYMRPKSAPSSTLVTEAEKIIADLNLESALKRRIATIDDVIKFFWKKPEEKDTEKHGGVFSNVRTKDDAKNKVNNNIVDVTDKPLRVTLKKFMKTVLPNALKINVALHGYGRYPFCSLTTACDPDAEPLIKWDSKEARNPLCQYVYNGGATCPQFNVNPSSEVIAIVPRSSDMLAEDTDYVLFIIKDCRDKIMSGGSALFPQSLRSELYPVRKVIESYSSSTPITDIPADAQAAAGLMYGNGSTWDFALIVETATTRMKYIIDRFE